MVLRQKQEHQQQLLDVIPWLARLCLVTQGEQHSVVLQHAGTQCSSGWSLCTAAGSYRIVVLSLVILFCLRMCSDSV